jgi:hypothetical protein
MADAAAVEFPGDHLLRLERVIEADYIAVWLETPIPALDGKTPLDVR